MHRLLAAASIWLVSALEAAPPPPPPPGIVWSEKVDVARRLSASSGRPLLVYLHAAWCGPCKFLEQTTFRDPEVSKTSASFVTVKVDADADLDFTKKHDIHALPTILVLDGEGRELTRFEGYVPAEPFLETLLDVSGGYQRYLIDRRGQDGVSLYAAAQYLLRLGNDEDASKLLDRALTVADKAQTTLRETIRLDRAVIQLVRENVAGAKKEFDLLAESVEPEIQQRALVGLLVSAHALKNETDEHRAMALLSKLVLGVEIPD